MRPFVFATLICLSIPSIVAQNSIRQVDFKNFTYPLKDHLLGHGELQWLSAQVAGIPRLRTIQLKDGENLQKVPIGKIDDGGYYEVSGFTLQEVKYADLTGDGKEDAIVVLRYYTGGTQTTNYVYIYSFADGHPKLLAYCHTGSRADFGLYGVYGEHGGLVFELLDPEKSEGDCCSSGFVRTRYRWDGSRFEAVGAPEYGSAEIETRPLTR
jgi:hypothetical protein